MADATDTTTKKSHVAKPEEWDGQDLDRFWRSVRLYTIANKRDFETDEDKIIFALSFMRKGAADAWAHNFIDKALEYDPIAWGTWENFEKELQSAFADPNKKKTAQDKLAKLRQGNSTAEEFFQQFDILSRSAGYGTDHDHFLIDLVERNMRFSLIEKIYSSGSIPDTLANYRKCIIALDALERRLASVNRTSGSGSSAKGSSTPNWRQPIEKTKATPEQPSTPVQTRRDGTGTTFGGRGQPMDIERARREGLCFNCGEKGHLSRDCLKPRKSTRTYARRVVDGLSEEDHKDLLAELGFPKGQ